jgi:hypothetical protein
MSAYEESPGYFKPIAYFILEHTCYNALNPNTDN